jgi:hypothetical protein
LGYLWKHFTLAFQSWRTNSSCALGTLKTRNPTLKHNTRCHEYAWAQCLDRDFVSKHYSISCEPLALSLSPTLSWDKKCKKDGGREYTY